MKKKERFDRLVRVATNVNVNRDSVDTRSRLNGVVAHQLRRHADLRSLTKAMELFTETYNMQSGLRGSQSSRAIDAYTWSLKVENMIQRILDNKKANKLRMASERNKPLEGLKKEKVVKEKAPKEKKEPDVTEEDVEKAGKEREDRLAAEGAVVEEKDPKEKVEEDVTEDDVANAGIEREKRLAAEGRS
jgi:hypothetical protein